MGNLELHKKIGFNRELGFNLSVKFPAIRSIISFFRVFLIPRKERDTSLLLGKKEKKAAQAAKVNAWIKFKNLFVGFKTFPQH